MASEESRGARAALDLAAKLQWGIMAALLTIAMGAGGYLFSAQQAQVASIAQSLAVRSERIAVLEANDRAIDQQLVELRARLSGIDTKLDRLLEESRRRP